MDKFDLKDKILDYLINCGFVLDTTKKPPVVRCPDPSHEDKTPSAIVYPDRVYCPVCNLNWDVFDIAGFVNGTTDFKEQKKAVQKSLGVEKLEPTKKRKKKAITKQENYICLTIDEAREIYNDEDLLEFYNRCKFAVEGADIVAAWPYRNEDGSVICIDARFEAPGNKKQVITFWYDGAFLKMKNPPDTLFGLHKLPEFEDRPVLIVEGCKTAKAAEVMHEFVAMTWRGGSNRVSLIDWSPLNNRVIYILPDDDKTGVKAAVEIKGLLPHAKIVEPYKPAREVKEKGADVVEYLDLLTPEELTEYIKTNTIEDKKAAADKAAEEPLKLPFKVLGRAGENDTYFIDRDGWMIGCPHGAYGKVFCLRLAPLNWWKFDSGMASDKFKVYWDDVLCWLIGESNKDFDPATIRGRGAWKSKAGQTCFNDGRRIWGTKDDNCHYLKMQTLNIDLDHKPATLEQRSAALDITLRLIFANDMDAIRTLTWATLAPFCGALPWRSAALITGSSESGKSTIIDHIIEPISVPLKVSGGESTEPGVRQAIGSDSRAVVIEEAEKDTDKKAGRREDLFSLMRQSTSDNAPIVAKGTQDGKGMSFQLRSMFLFAAISPEVAQIADDNRIFKINLKASTREDRAAWPELKAELVDRFRPEVCAGIRSFTWKNLDRIVSFADTIATFIQEELGRSTRYSLAEGLFLSCYYIVYLGKTEDTIDDIEEDILKLLSTSPKDETRDDAAEMLGRILDENIHVSSTRGYRSIGELARILGESRQIEEDGSFSQLIPGDSRDYRQAIGRHGVTVSNKGGDLCIAKRHHRISEITGAAAGYDLTLKRIGMETKEKPCRFTGGTRQAIVFPNYYKLHEINEGDGY